MPDDLARSRRDFERAILASQKKPKVKLGIIVKSILVGLVCVVVATLGLLFRLSYMIGKVSPPLGPNQAVAIDVLPIFAASRVQALLCSVFLLGAGITAWFFRRSH
jgi:hypothetical protein